MKTYRPQGTVMTEDLRSQIIRCLQNELYMDAPLDEVADACECSPMLVQAVLDDMKVRRCLVHAGLVNEVCELGLDDSPEAVITMALEVLYSLAPQARRDAWSEQRRRREVLRGRKKSARTVVQVHHPGADGENEHEH